MNILRYNPNNTGLARWLGPELSAPLMAWLWDRADTVTVQMVVKYYDERRLDYNTAGTTLDRLAGIGLLIKTKRHNTRYYTPRYTREQWEAAQIAAVVASFENMVTVGDDGWGHGGWEA
jgi:predicted transcriptional regulator